MDSEFGFFSYENKNTITADMIVYAIEESKQINKRPDLIVIPECAVRNTDMSRLKGELSECFIQKHEEPIAFVFGVFGEKK